MTLDELIENLSIQQHLLCAYGTFDGDGRSCDCKFGLGSLTIVPRGEMNGCPELRTAIVTLKALQLHERKEPDGTD